MNFTPMEILIIEFYVLMEHFYPLYCRNVFTIYWKISGLKERYLTGEACVLIPYDTVHLSHIFY